MEPKKLKFTADDLPIQSSTPKIKQQEVKKSVSTAVAAEGFTSRQQTKPKVDGRSLRKTNRNFQLNIGVSAGTRDQFWQMAADNGVASGGEFLQILLDEYSRKLT